MYNHKLIEKKWQKIWDDTKAFVTTDKYQRKCYVLDMFPYPSGAGLHVGHPEGYTASDIIARYKRLNQFDVLHPIGWDAFGLPAEQYALQTGNHPHDFTQQNIVNFRRQLKALGFSYDYDKEIDTTDPAYYKWTQWIFGKLFEHDLAERKEIEVNWCEGLGTVLANEEVLELTPGEMVSERGNFPVIKKPMMQWVLKITKYAHRLVEGLNVVQFPESLKSLQRNWILNEDGSLHLKDWVFSRQRYWGEPIPIIFDQTNHPFLVKDLPLILPKLTEIKPSGTGESPLVNAKDWMQLIVENQPMRRESNTMPQWAGSSWYYLAYILKQADGSYLPLDSPAAYAAFTKWLPVDVYIGGQEHAVLHLLYARFWHQFLYDIKVVPTPEPFFKIINQGMILGPDGQKMSKSRGNVINPDAIVEEFGADTLRVYEMFMGPLEDTKTWSTESIRGIRKWLDRVKRLFDRIKKPITDHGWQIDANYDNAALVKAYHTMIQGVTDDIEKFKFNLGISKMMVYVNELYKHDTLPSLQYLRDFAIVLSPYSPHLAEECLALLDEPMLKDQTWPTYDAKFTTSSNANLALQVNGKLRALLEIDLSESEVEIIARAKALSVIQTYLNQGKLVKTIYVPGKILNFVIKN